MKKWKQSKQQNRNEISFIDYLCAKTRSVSILKSLYLSYIARTGNYISPSYLSSWPQCCFQLSKNNLHSVIYMDKETKTHGTLSHINRVKILKQIHVNWTNTLTRKPWKNSRTLDHFLQVLWPPPSRLHTIINILKKEFNFHVYNIEHQQNCT